MRVDRDIAQRGVAVGVGGVNAQTIPHITQCGCPPAGEIIVVVAVRSIRNVISAPSIKYQVRGTEIIL